MRTPVQSGSPEGLSEASNHSCAFSPPRNNSSQASVKRAMRRSASLVGLVAVALVGCQGGDEATSVERGQTTIVATIPVPPEQTVLTSEEKILGWIRSCNARRIVFAHAATHATLRDGRTVRLRIKA